MAALTSLDSSVHSNAQPFSLGINCRGNLWCPWSSKSSNRILPYLLGWIAISVNDEDVYETRAHIACVDLYAPSGVTGASFCLFTQGPNVPQPRINGSEMKRKLRQLSDHGCFACGSVPLAEDNDPNAMGILTLNYVLKRACESNSFKNPQYASRAYRPLLELHHYIIPQFHYLLFRPSTSQI